jgi:tetratricopeptide (TPR) repeat protein
VQTDHHALYGEVLSLLRRADWRGAAARCAVLNAEHPAFAPGWLMASIIAQQLGDHGAALERAERASGLAPRDATFVLRRAQCLEGLRRRPEALALAEEAERLAARQPEVLDAIGDFYSLIGEQRRALHAHDQAVAQAPNQPRWRFKRALVRRFVGQLAEAEADYDRVLALDPQEHEAYLNRSDLRTQTADRNHVSELERLLGGKLPTAQAEVLLRYALAKEYEDLGRYQESFAQLERGAQLRRRNLQYDVATDIATVDWLIEAFPDTPVEPTPGAASEAPIFIVGLPRSGTTLVDRILSSHSGVVSAGERRDLLQALFDAVRSASGLADQPLRALIGWMARIDFAALGRDYLARARPAAGAARFTDKMPINYLYCGLIRRALPNARIVHVTRQPLAACYAIYKTLFREAYPFSYDLRELGQYYVAYRRMMDHWRRTMPGVIHDLSYERLVADQLGESRRLLEFCGLPWEDACLDFHLNPAPSTTASAHQVRRPLYESSVSQWRHYARQLEGLRRELIAAGIEVEPESA